MARQRAEADATVTAADVEARWRALQARAGRAFEEAIVQTEPLPLVLAGLGLVALGAARWLRRSPTHREPDELDSRGPDSLGADTVTTRVTDAAPPTHPGAVSEAILRGLVEGLVASGVLPRAQPVSSSGVSGDA